MELLVISESKLKIMLTAPDMVKYDLAATQTDGLSPHHREALRHLFRDAKTEIGFDTEGARLFVQFYSSREGGCEIFVTKLPENSLLPPAWENGQSNVLSDLSHAPCPKHPRKRTSDLPTSEDRLLHAIRNFEKQDLPYARLAYRFSDIESLLAACRRLSSLGYGTRRPGKSHVYIVDHIPSTGWYLLLEHPTSNESDHLLFLSEYADAVDPDYVAVYLTEHGTSIASENAVEILKNM